MHFIKLQEGCNLIKNNFISEIGWVALGGMIGASLRHFTNQLFFTTTIESNLFTATVFENILGSFLIGLIYVVLSKRFETSNFLNLFLLTGIIGSYTTYSGFMIEALLISGESLFTLFVYIFLQITFGFLALWAGLTAGKQI